MKELPYQHCSNIYNLSPKGVVLFWRRFFFLWLPEANVKEQLIPGGSGGIPVSHLQSPEDIIKLHDVTHWIRSFSSVRCPCLCAMRRTEQSGVFAFVDVKIQYHILHGKWAHLLFECIHLNHVVMWQSKDIHDVTAAPSISMKTQLSRRPGSSQLTTHRNRTLFRHYSSENTPTVS